MNQKIFSTKISYTNVPFFANMYQTHPITYCTQKQFQRLNFLAKPVLGTFSEKENINAL